MKKVPLPEWCVSVKKAMVERDDMIRRKMTLRKVPRRKA